MPIMNGVDVGMEEYFVGMEKSLGLRKVIVHYCTLGRKDKKPTHLWTNVRMAYAAICFLF